MDNVTHSLIGLIAGEAVIQHTRPSPNGLPAPVRRTLLVVVAVIGSNSPDLDLLFSLRGTAGGRLDYMLWHRGYTHTVLGCLLLTLALYAAADAWVRLKHLRASHRDRALLLGTALFTTALHLGMDYLNSYGVHPFWPADNRWSYGDSVFIVEPCYWVAAAPLLMVLRSRVTRALFAAALISIIALGAASRLVSIPSCIALGVAAACLTALGSRISAAAAARVSTGLWLALTCGFVLAGRSAALQADALAHAVFAEDRLIDHVLTPMPANPFCWDLLLLETKNDRYIARRAVLAIETRVTAAAECPKEPQLEHTAPLSPVAAADSSAVQWLGEFSMTRSELAAYINRSCEAAAFMQFARAPFVAQVHGSETVMGDLRFDHGRERGSFDVNLPLDGTIDRPCGRAAPWTAPRADLIAR